MSPAVTNLLRSWPTILLGVWVMGMVILAAAWLTGYAWFLWRLPARIDGPAEWQEQWNQLLGEHGIRRPIPLHLTARSGPMLCRLPRGYRLLVPVELWKQLGPAGRLSVLRHELEHFRRGDVWKSLVARLAVLPHWFNPAAWWAVARLDEAAEWACDAAACTACPTAAADYAKSLLALNELAGRHALLRPAAWGRGLSQRIRRLTAGHISEDTIMKRVIVVGAALCLVVALGVRFELVAKGRTATDKKKRIVTSLTVASTARDAPSAKASIVATPRGVLVTQVSKDAPAPASPGRTNLRYDGKSFDEWYRESKTELKTERRTEAIRAFTEFGRHGYGKEAAQAILEVMRDNSRAYGNSPEAKLWKAAQSAFRDIPPGQSVPVLIGELKQGNDNSRNFALDVLSNLGPQAKAAIPALLDIWEAHSDGRVLGGIMSADLSGERVVPLVQKALAAKDVARLTLLFNSLAPQGSDRNALVEYDPASVEEIKRLAELESLAGRGTPYRKPKLRLTAMGRAVLPILVEAVGDKVPEIRRAAILAITRCQGAAKSALPGLLRAFEKGDSQDCMAVAAALANWGPDAASAAPVLIRGFERSTDFREKATIAYTLGKMGAAAKDALPLIEKAMQDVSDNPSLTRDQWQTLWSNFRDARQSIVNETHGVRRPPAIRPSRGATSTQPAASPKSAPPSASKPAAKEPKGAKADASKSP